MLVIGVDGCVDGGDVVELIPLYTKKFFIEFLNNKKNKMKSRKSCKIKRCDEGFKLLRGLPTNGQMDR